MTFLKKVENFNILTVMTSWEIRYRFPNGDVQAWSIDYRISVERQTFSRPPELVHHITILSDENLNGNLDNQNALYAVNVYTVILQEMLEDGHGSVEIWGE